MFTRHQPKFTAYLVLGLATSLTGCASLTSDSKGKKNDDKSWFFFKKKEYQIPQAMNVVWTYDVLTLPGKPATRGFGGRLYFYNEKTQAIPVDGELMVYGFDDTYGNVDSHDLSSAAKRFKFTSEQLTSHFSEGQLGASYSVWIPWDAAPGDEKKIMLIPTFVAQDGRLVKGAPATVNLPGKKRAEEHTTIMQVNNQVPLHSLEPLNQAAQAVAMAPASNRGVMTLNMPHRTSSSQVNSPDLIAAFERMQAAAVTQQTELQQSYQAAQAGVMQSQGPAGLVPPPSVPQPMMGQTPMPQLTIQPMFNPPQANTFPSGTQLTNAGVQSAISMPQPNWNKPQLDLPQPSTQP